MIDPEEYEDDEIPARRSYWPVVVAAILVVAVAIAFGANAFFSVAPSVFRSAGDRDEHAFLQSHPDGGPVRYDPCSPLRYVINRESAPEGAVADLRTAIAQFEDAMDVDFVFDGYTEEVPSSDRPIYQPDAYSKKDWAPILIAWVPPDQLLQPDDQAVGAAGSTYIENSRDQFVYVTGMVTFNAEAKLLPGFELGDSWGDVALHELGHLVGLAHVDDDNQVMYPDVTAGEARLGAGDLAGLERLGREAGCMQVPKPS